MNLNDPTRPLGLVVPPRGVVISDGKGNVIRDTIAEDEIEYRRNGRPPVIFDDGDPHEPFY